MRANEFLVELNLPKNAWVMLTSNSDKAEVSDKLIRLVSHAYANSKHGSFIRNAKDVIPSDWYIINWDENSDIDAAIFYRSARSNEKWVGHKIQGIGHDGTRMSKDKAISKLQELLNLKGWWIESSAAMRSVLKKYNAPAVTDEELLKRLFNDPGLQMVSNDTYTRSLPTGQHITETIFGNPILK